MEKGGQQKTGGAGLKAYSLMNFPSQQGPVWEDWQHWQGPCGSFLRANCYRCATVQNPTAEPNRWFLWRQQELDKRILPASGRRLPSQPKLMAESRPWSQHWRGGRSAQNHSHYHSGTCPLLTHAPATLFHKPDGPGSLINARTPESHLLITA